MSNMTIPTHTHVVTLIVAIPDRPGSFLQYAFIAKLDVHVVLVAAYNIMQKYYLWRKTAGNNYYARYRYSRIYSYWKTMQLTLSCSYSFPS